jgi:hypothetical protein
MRSVEEDCHEICCNLRDFVGIVPVGRLLFADPGLFWPLTAIEGETWGVGE